MAEEDMPMLDSPALQELIEQQVGTPNLPGLLDAVIAASAPAIVITDTSNPETPALSSSSVATPILAHPVAPQTPAPQPIMGTFHPTTDDPAQHAVIDGSKTATKSPFTHRRRPRKGRADSMSSAHTSLTGTAAAERKRRSHAHSIDPFAPPVPRTLPKRARYSSIPGHPRYIAAQRAYAAPERETTPSDDGEGGIELEDMLETSVLVHELEQEAAGADEHLRHLIRFDRVPVSSYLRRNFGGRERYADQQTVLGVDLSMGMGMGMSTLSSPMRGRGSGVEDTLAGPMGRMLVSPVLVPTNGERKGRRGRRMEALQI
jgi:hypothetical protein